MAVLSLTPTLVPNGAEISALAPAYLYGSSLAHSRVAVDLHAGQVLQDGLLEPVSGASISSRATVLNINFVGHK